MIYYVEDDANIRELVVYTLNQTGLAARVSRMVLRSLRLVQTRSLP
jgi:DNA-binding response OmpR family regulator